MVDKIIRKRCNTMQPLWIAIYKNEEVLREYNGDGTHNNFYDIDRDNLSQFRLVCSPYAVLKFDCLTGELCVNKTKIDNNTLNNITRLGLDYGKGLIQFKEAKVYASARGISDEMLLSANLGYKVEYNNHLYQFILTHTYEDFKTTLEIKITDLSENVIIDQSRYEI